MDKWPTYPIVNVETMHYDRDMLFYVRMYSKLRVYHLGKWYYQKFFQEYAQIEPLMLAKITQSFHSEVYLTLHLGQVDLGMKDMYDNPVWELCEDQTDETERLKKISKLYFK